MAKKKIEKPKPPEKKAVIYARYSTDHQNPSSIEAQVRACNAYAEKHDLEVVRVYKDEAKSGTESTKRAGFREMLEDSQDGEFSKVIVFSIDRFSRNLRNYLNDVYSLEKNGVSIRSATEQIDDSFSGKTLAVVLMLSAELYVKSVVKHIKKSQQEAARKGLYVGGTVPLGYYINSQNEYVPNEEEAKTVRKIFEMYVSGKSYDEITDHLNFEGKRTKADREFRGNSLYGILHNEKYIGTYRYGDGENPESEYDPIVLPDKLPAIITKDLFDKAQAKLIERKRVLAEGRLREIIVSLE